MVKINSYKEFINESIRLKDHVVDVNKAEQGVVALMDKDPKLKEVVPTNVREWNMFSKQLAELYKIIADFEKDGTLPNAKDVREAVFFNTHSDYKRSVFEVMDNWYTLSQESKGFFNSVGFHETHLKGVIRHINEKFSERNTHNDNLAKFGPEQQKAFEESIHKVEELHSKLESGWNHKMQATTHSIEDPMQIVANHLGYEYKSYSPNAEADVFQWYKSKDDDPVVKIVNKWLKQNGYSQHMLSSLIQDTCTMYKNLLFKNREAQRAKGFDDWFIVKPANDQTQKMRTPEMKAFEKSGKTKLYIDDADSRYGSKTPEFPTTTANLITDFKMASGSYSLFPMFSMRTSQDVLNLTGNVNIKPIKYGGSGRHTYQLGILPPMPINCTGTVEISITEEKYLNWILESYKGGSYLLTTTFSIYSKKDVEQCKQAIEKLKNAGFTVKYNWNTDAEEELNHQIEKNAKYING